MSNRDLPELMRQYESDIVYARAVLFHNHYIDCEICRIEPPVTCGVGRLLLQELRMEIDRITLADWVNMMQRDAHIETLARRFAADVIGGKANRAELEARYGKVWDEQQMEEHFELLGLFAPFVIVRRKSDKAEEREIGSLEYQNEPRFYFNFVADTKYRLFNRKPTKE